MTFDVVAPEEGTVLDVGKNIGGIYSTEAGSTITVSGGEFNFNTGLLKAGETYTADDFISVMDDLGTLNITEYIRISASNGRAFRRTATPTVRSAALLTRSTKTPSRCRSA